MLKITTNVIGNPFWAVWPDSVFLADAVDDVSTV